MRVAITQDNITSGGRLAVILEMIEVLNDQDIIPNIICFKMHLTPKEIEKKYAKSLQFQTITLKPNAFKKLPEFNKLWFNLLSRKYISQYDLFIDSNNTSFLMSGKKTVLSMIYGPRIDRVLKKDSIHKTDTNKFTLKTRIGQKIDKFIASPIYTFHKIHENNLFYTISDFSRQAIIRRYGIEQEAIKIIYQPVDIDAFNPNQEKNDWVATIGRFSPAKNQLEQIKIAKKVPDLIFHIMGFTDVNSNYYQKCEDYISKHRISNVILHPNINYKSMIDILECSKYFLHTIWNEPFGITAVQGIAAGCVPNVPNCGGQTEVVPIDRLRFDSFEESIAIFKNLIKENLAEINLTLLKHIELFNIVRFKENFQLILRDYISD
ncbi:MAG: glycosyltransferase family 4 protein [Bacteroidetes bacterium]|nr:glycosyltransferase family 4 protein [Bacteroidota bacterium]